MFVCMYQLMLLFMQFTDMIHAPGFIVFCFNEAATLICELRQQQEEEEEEEEECTYSHINGACHQMPMHTCMAMEIPLK